MPGRNRDQRTAGQTLRAGGSILVRTHMGFNPAIETDRELGQKTVARLLWRLLPFLFLLYIVAFLDRINVGFAALEMQEQLGLNDRIYGLAAGLFFAGYFFFQLPSNLVLAKVGARRWIALIML